MGRKFRARTAMQVVKEMVAIKEMGIDEVLIYDDTFTVDRQRVKDICRLLIGTNLGIVFDIRTRVDCVDEELLRLLKEAGCKRIHYGIEASSNSILRSLGKGITLEQVETAFKATKRVGIETLAYFIIGSPGETIADIEHTIKYAKELNPDYCHFAIMTPYPDTPLYQSGLTKGAYNDYWTEFAREPGNGFKTPYWGEIEEEELDRLLNKAYKGFYLRPRQVMREIWKTRSMGSIAKKAKAALGIIRRK